MIPSHLRLSRLTLAAVLAALLALPASAAIRLGSPGGETITGTHQADQLTGDAGNDALRGLAGDDTYHFADGWGVDTLDEKRTYRVGGKTRPGGRDALSFAGVRNATEGVSVYLVPEWRSVSPGYNHASEGTDRVDLGTSLVEDAVGSRGSEDDLFGGGAANRLATGGGGNDYLNDYGGWDDGPGGHPELAESNDTFRGAAANTSGVTVTDWGGAADVLDLRPLASDEVYLAATDCDGSDPARECLQVVTPTSAASGVFVHGQFGAFANYTADYGQQGRVETLLFADGPVSFGGGAKTARSAAGGGGDGEALLGKAETRQQKELAERAPALAEEARREAWELPAPGARPEERGR